MERFLPLSSSWCSKTLNVGMRGPQALMALMSGPPWVFSMYAGLNASYRERSWQRTLHRCVALVSDLEALACLSD